MINPCGTSAPAAKAGRQFVGWPRDDKALLLPPNGKDWHARMAEARMLHSGSWPLSGHKRSKGG